MQLVWNFCIGLGPSEVSDWQVAANKDCMWFDWMQHQSIQPTLHDSFLRSGFMIYVRTWDASMSFTVIFCTKKVWRNCCSSMCHLFQTYSWYFWAHLCCCLLFQPGFVFCLAMNLQPPTGWTIMVDAWPIFDLAWFQRWSVPLPRPGLLQDQQYGRAPREVLHLIGILV